jgi:glutamine synthetase
VECLAEKQLLKRISRLCDTLYARCEDLSSAISADKIPADLVQRAKYYRETVLTLMNELREAADELETLVSKDYWPFPSYGRVMYKV